MRLTCIFQYQQRNSNIIKLKCTISIPAVLLSIMMSLVMMMQTKTKNCTEDDVRPYCHMQCPISAISNAQALNHKSLVVNEGE
jgi:hypothetical protein